MLILKSQIKELFNKAGLEGFTVARHEYNKDLYIVGPCGKPLVQVTNFPVGTKLSTKEREVAIDEYIAPALTEHGKTLQKLVTANVALRAAEADVQKAKDTFYKKHKVNISFNGYGEYKGQGIQTTINDKKHQHHIGQVFVSDKGNFVNLPDTNFMEVAKIMNKFRIIAKDMKPVYDLFEVEFKARDTFGEVQEKLVKECGL